MKLTVKDILEQAIIKFAPDLRTTVFEVDAEGYEGKLILSGKISGENLKREFLLFVKSKIEFGIIDRIVTLPDSSTDNKNFGVVSVSVANLHKEPLLSSTLMSQALAGTPVSILEKMGEWFRVQTPDKYVGWMYESIVSFTKEEYDQWTKKDKIIITDLYAFIYKENSMLSDTIGDLVAGDILAYEEKPGDYYKVQYPDLRRGFVAKRSAVPLKEWLLNTNATRESIISTAKRFMGIPYLWGGTSSKALDCSGFAKLVFFLNGILLPRDADQQSLVGCEIETDESMKDLLPGDLLFFGAKESKGKKECVTHVGISLGEMKFMEASRDIHISSLDKTDHLYNKKRAETFLRSRHVLGSETCDGIKLLKDIRF